MRGGFADASSFKEDDKHDGSEEVCIRLVCQASDNGSVDIERLEKTGAVEKGSDEHSSREDVHEITEEGLCDFTVVHASHCDGEILLLLLELI